MTDTMANGKPRIAFIGFGEAGQAIAAGLHEADAAQMTAWDILFPHAAGNNLRRAADASGVRCATSAADAVTGAEIIVSAVTAASSPRRRNRSRRICAAARSFSTSIRYRRVVSRTLRKCSALPPAISTLP